MAPASINRLMLDGSSWRRGIIHGSGSWEKYLRWGGERRMKKNAMDCGRDADDTVMMMCCWLTFSVVGKAFLGLATGMILIVLGSH